MFRGRWEKIFSKKNTLCRNDPLLIDDQLNDLLPVFASLGLTTLGTTLVDFVIPTHRQYLTHFSQDSTESYRLIPIIDNLSTT